MSEANVLSESNKPDRQRSIFRWVIIAALIAAAAFNLISWIVLPSNDNTAGGSNKYATGTTPVEAVQQWEEQVRELSASSFTHLQTRDYAGYSVVLYELPTLPGEMLFHQLVKGRADEWYIACVSDGSGSTLIDTAGGHPPYIKWTDGKMGAPAIFYGRAVSDEVAAVEFDFRDGQTVRAPVQDGLFIVVSGTSFGCDAVRALDANGEVLSERIN